MPLSASSHALLSFSDTRMVVYVLPRRHRSWVPGKLEVVLAVVVRSRYSGRYCYFFFFLVVVVVVVIGWRIFPLGHQGCWPGWLDRGLGNSRRDVNIDFRCFFRRKKENV